MSKRVLIVPDKFKGTLTAREAADAIAAGWSARRPQDELDLLPMSDGGDGFGPVIGELLGAEARSEQTVDAAHRPCTARWWWAADRRLAVIETAQSNGLALLPKGRFHPFELDTLGTGRLLQAAIEAGARTGYLGVGGSATNDGGFGLARAMGWRFLRSDGSEIERWIELDRLAAVEPPARPDDMPRWIVATDVSNPLLGPEGATRVYGPQKGLRPEDLAAAERCLQRLAEVIHATTGFDAGLPGCGAAGGLGFGLQAFLGAERQLGFDVFAGLSRLEERLARADLVITGEGSVDRSSLMGKGVGQLIDLCRRHGRPVIVLGGRADVSELPECVLSVRDLVTHAGEDKAMTDTAPAMRSLAAAVASTAVLPGAE